MKIEMDNRIAWLEFDHGKANEMGRVQLQEIDELGRRLLDSGVLALVSFSRRISKRGTPIFIAGANVTERQGWSREEVEAHVRYQRDVLSRFRRLPIFHIAVVHGVALGWGTEWLITCDYRIATAGAAFALPETGLGILPGAGGTSDLASMIGLPQTIRLGMTGEKIDGAEAERIGLVQEVVADLDSGLDRARSLGSAVARRSPTALATFKSATLAAIGRTGEERREIEARAYEHCVRSGEATIGRESFLAIRKGEPVSWGPRKPFDPEK